MTTISLPPAPIEEVTIPSVFSVTAIGSSGGCRLRMVLASSLIGSCKLPSGPKAELGLLGHAVLERVNRGEGEGEAVFEMCRREALEKLSAEPNTSSYSDLAAVVGAAAWSRFRTEVIARSKRVVRSKPFLAASPRPSTTKLSPGREKNFVSCKLRLKGRLDGLTFQPESGWVIRDYKLGQIRDRRGQIRPEIIFQLRSYGLLVLEQEGSAEIRLIVDDGEEHEIPFGSTDRTKGRRELKKALRGLKPDAAVHARDIASPGDCCADCPFRHRCGSYLEAAPLWWNLTLNTPSDLARDVWGTVVEFQSAGSGEVCVTVKNTMGKTAQVDRIDRRHGIDSRIIGQDIWLFGLESTVYRHAPDGRAIHPTTFHELPADSTQRRAWALAFYSLNTSLRARPSVCDQPRGDSMRKSLSA